MRHHTWTQALVGAAVIVSPVAAQVRQDFGVMVPMRDGVKLAADVWRPASPGKYPVILIRLPYMKTAGFLDADKLGPWFATRGYAVVVQDVRGRGDSEGEFGFFFADAADGFDSIEWLAAEPWSDGRVGMMGVSYLGTVQWLAARERPPHLACIAPTAAAGRYFDELPYTGGAFVFSWALGWINGTSGRQSQDPNVTDQDLRRALAHRPILAADSVYGRIMPLYRDFLEHPTMDAWWKRIQFAPGDFGRISIPVLHVTGWFDGDQPGAMFYWRGMQEGSAARDKQFLLVGPWLHVQTFRGGERRVGEMELGPESVVDNKAIHLAFFDWCLKGAAPMFDFPRARVYVTGLNRWKDFDAYPPKQVTERPLYLHSGGRANSIAGDGRLTWDPPAAEPPDRYTYDPKQPVPTNSDDEAWARDQRAVERRDDVLVFTGDALTEPVEIIGSVTATVHAATDARDTDFLAKLVDVYPDGRAVLLGSRIGIRRARYRHGYEREELLTPNQVEAYRIELFDIAHSFQPGHRIRVEISSSAAPMYNPNQNTGNPVATDTEWKVARQTVYHDRARASAITLPVVSRVAVP
jgi:hypothetical protein